MTKAREIATMNNVHAADRLSSLMQLLNADDMHEIACRLSEKVVSFCAGEQARARNAIAAKRAWLRGEIDDATLLAAGEAARKSASQQYTVCASHAAMAARNAARLSPEESLRLTFLSVSCALVRRNGVNVEKVFEELLSSIAEYIDCKEETK